MRAFEPEKISFIMCQDFDFLITEQYLSTRQCPASTSATVWTYVDMLDMLAVACSTGV